MARKGEKSLEQQLFGTCCKEGYKLPECFRQQQERIREIQ
jgi:hypothetical protein